MVWGRQAGLRTALCSALFEKPPTVLCSAKFPFLKLLGQGLPALGVLRCPPGLSPPWCPRPGGNEDAAVA